MNNPLPTACLCKSKSRGNAEEEEKIILLLLSTEPLTNRGLMAILKNHSNYSTVYDKAVNVRKHLDRRLLTAKKRGKVDNWHGEWYTIGSEAERITKKRQEKVRGFGVPKTQARRGPYRLRDVIFEILQELDLTLGQLLEAIEYHPGYNTECISKKVLTGRVQAILHNSLYPFEKKNDTERNARWGTKSRIVTLPPLKASPRRDALFRIIHQRGEEKGCAFDDILSAVLQPGSGYKVRKGESLETTRANVTATLHAYQEHHFERVANLYTPEVQWQIKPPVIHRTPPPSSRRRKINRQHERFEYLRDRGIEIISKSQDGWLRVGNVITPARIGESKEKTSLIESILTSLDPLERQVAKLLFFDDGAEYRTVVEAGVILGISWKEVPLILQSALDKFASNRQLQEII